MNTEQLRLMSLNQSLNHSTEYSKESLIDSERMKWKSYLFRPTHSESIRLSLTEYIYNLIQNQNRSIFHLTTTYKSYQDRIYKQSDIDRFFINFYRK